MRKNPELRHHTLLVALCGVLAAGGCTDEAVGAAYPEDSVVLDEVIANGYEDIDGRFPGTLRVGGGSCSGTLVAEAAVITAAHCVCRAPGDCIARSIVTTPAGTIGCDVHGYDGWTDAVSNADATGDIAVLLLDEPIRDIQPVPWGPLSIDVGVPLVVVGWGQSAPGLGAGTRRYSDDLNLDAVTHNGGTFLAHADGTGVGVRPGDSGGTLLVNGVLVGVTSFYSYSSATGEVLASGFAALGPARRWLEDLVNGSNPSPTGLLTVTTDVDPGAPHPWGFYRSPGLRDGTDRDVVCTETGNTTALALSPTRFVCSAPLSEFTTTGQLLLTPKFVAQYRDGIVHAVSDSLWQDPDRHLCGATPGVTTTATLDGVAVPLRVADGVAPFYCRFSR